MLWKGDSTEKTNFAHLWAIADNLGRGTRLDDIDTHAVDKVIKGQAKLGEADGTINRYLSHLRTFFEIGRASCREIVCRFVSFLVVSVTLKNKSARLLKLC